MEPLSEIPVCDCMSSGSLLYGILALGGKGTYSFTSVVFPNVEVSAWLSVFVTSNYILDSD